MADGACRRCQCRARGARSPATDVALVDNATNYIEVSAAGAIVSNASAFTGGASSLYTVAVSDGIVTGIEDHRYL